MPFDNILEFVEGPTGLNWPLLPVQRFILKLFYGIELDAHDARIQIFDRFQEQHRYSLTEVDYLNYLYGEGRCNVSDQSSLHRRGLVLAAGRLTGKSTLAEMIASYAVIQMLQMGNPHEGLRLPSARLELVAAYYVGLSSEGVDKFLSGVNQNIIRCEDLRLALAPLPTQKPTKIQFITPKGKEEGLDRGNLSLQARTSKRTACGLSYYTLILDGLAQMPNEQETFHARIPPVLVSGHSALLSTPRSAEGPFYNYFYHARAFGVNDYLALQLPTWEVQTLPRGFLREQFMLSPQSFTNEYGAEFVPVQPEQEPIKEKLEERKPMEEDRTTILTRYQRRPVI